MERFQTASTADQPANLATSESLLLAARTHQQQAETYLAQGLAQAARDTLAQAYTAVIQSAKHKPKTGYTEPNFGTLTLTLARIYSQQGYYKEAEGFFLDALGYLRAEGSQTALGAAYFVYGQALKERGSYEKACHYLGLAYETCQGKC